MTEEWRPIPNVAGYEASSEGRVRSVDRVVTRESRGRVTHQPLRGRILRPCLLKNGYLHVVLGRRDSYVHQLVCAAWHGAKPEPLSEVAHGNGDRSDNRPSNLRWASRVDNAADRVTHGTALRGERQNGAVLTAPDVAEIRRRHAAGEASYSKLASDFGVHVQTIANIVTRRTWRHVEDQPARPVPALAEPNS